MATVSPYAPVPIPDDVALPEFLLRRCEEFGPRVALEDHCTGATVRYDELRPQSQAVAANLQARGVAPGTVVGLFAPNQPQWVVALLGIIQAGAVPTSTNPMYTAPELAQQLRECGARYLLTTPALLPTVRAAGLPLKEVFVFGPAPDAAVTSFETLLCPPPAPFCPVPVAPRDSLAFLPFSSGTTSRPKGVRLSHYNIVANLCQMDCPAMMDFTASDTFLVVLPLYHIYALVVVCFMGLMKGVRLVTVPRFQPGMYLGALAKHRVTVAHVAPPLVTFLAKDPSVTSYSLPALRTVFSAAAPLGQELAQALVQRIGCTLRQGYGMTELSPITHMMPFVAQHKYHSIGRLVPNMALKIVDVVTGQLVAPGERGEFWLKGPNVMLGYMNAAADTAATIDPEGYLHTGDIGYMDADGDCYVVDRCKELIKVKGFQVAPAELEDVLQGHALVQDCAVVGRPAGGEDERPHAFVVLHPGHSASDATAAAILAAVNERVAPFKRILTLTFVERIPKSPSGKILRRNLRQVVTGKL